MRNPRRSARVCALCAADGTSASSRPPRRSALAHWESGRRRPPEETLARLFDALDAPELERARWLSDPNPNLASPGLPNALLGPGDVLRAMRLRRGWTQSRVAARVGVTQPAVARWERGERDLGTAIRGKVAAALGATPDEIAALAWVSPGACLPDDPEAAFHAAGEVPAALGEVSWMGLEARLRRGTAVLPSLVGLYAAALGRRAEWYVLMGRPREAIPVARLALASMKGPEPWAPTAAAFALANAAELLGAGALTAYRTLSGWPGGDTNPGVAARVTSLRATAILGMDVERAVRLGREAVERARGAEAEDLGFCACALARALLRSGDPEAAWRTIEGQEGPETDAERARAMLALGETPPAAIMEHLRRTAASRGNPFYMDRLRSIERTSLRLR